MAGPCDGCAHFTMDGDGPEYNGNWPICTKRPGIDNLKSFPFKKDMPCHEPNGWEGYDIEDDL